MVPLMKRITVRGWTWIISTAVCLGIWRLVIYAFS
jgi:hypothetical protein